MTNNDDLFETKAAGEALRDFVEKSKPTNDERRKMYNLLCGIESAIKRGIQGYAHGMSKGKYVSPPWNNEEFVRNIAIEIKGLEWVENLEESYRAKKLREKQEHERWELERRQREQALDDKLDRFLQ